jgi:hypothetical protein
MQINIPILPAALFAIAVFLVVMANIVFYSILGEVNGKRSPDKQISMLFVNVKLYEVIRLHKELFPASRKRIAAVVLAGSGVALGLSIFVLGSS